jgi:hypothetical protein
MKPIMLDAETRAHRPVDACRRRNPSADRTAGSVATTETPKVQYITRARAVAVGEMAAIGAQQLAGTEIGRRAIMPAVRMSRP